MVAVRWDYSNTAGYNSDYSALIMLTKARVICLNLPSEIQWEIALVLSMKLDKLHKPACSPLVDYQLVVSLSCWLYRRIIIRTQTARPAM